MESGSDRQLKSMWQTENQATPQSTLIRTIEFRSQNNTKERMGMRRQ